LSDRGEVVWEVMNMTAGPILSVTISIWIFNFYCAKQVQVQFRLGLTS
jgi:hypothetical protein